MQFRGGIYLVRYALVALVVCATIRIVLCSSAYAGDNIWTYNGSAQWTAGGAWSLGRPPGENDNAFLDDGDSAAMPRIDGNAGGAAIANYDQNADGALSGDELKKAPALNAAIKRIDGNGDGNVTADEISSRIAAWQNSGIAITKVVAYVRQNQRPLAGAHVTLVPEEFLGPAVKSAEGTTDESGAAPLRISASPDEAGVHLGLYRIQVSKKGADGKETVPARFNAETSLGMEITADDPSSDRISIDLSR
jgi:hypothetical protein